MPVEDGERSPWVWDIERSHLAAACMLGKLRALVRRSCSSLSTSARAGKWSKKGSLAEMARPRLYHSTALLLPDCRVWIGGSDVTGETMAEIWAPPHLKLGPRPAITGAPDRFAPGDRIDLTFTSVAPVVKALLLRTGASTHSMAFDQRALWLEFAAPPAGGAVSLKTPGSYALIPPGM